MMRNPISASIDAWLATLPKPQVRVLPDRENARQGTRIEPERIGRAVVCVLDGESIRAVDRRWDVDPKTIRAYRAAARAAFEQANGAVVDWGEVFAGKGRGAARQKRASPTPWLIEWLCSRRGEWEKLSLPEIVRALEELGLPEQPTVSRLRAAFKYLGITGSPPNGYYTPFERWHWPTPSESFVDE